MNFLLALLCLGPLTFTQELEKIEIKESRQDFFHFSNPAQESLSNRDLEQRSLFHSEDIFSQFANINSAGGSNRTRYFQIRGIGERSEFDTIPSNSVGFFYDHIDLSCLSGVISLYDI
ncbi:MAG: hypothetical protein HRT44_03080, partial [Bdellovibrionales bacterium]|nr:hypothetical protein [Bdellovibrionales bacterium]NQZ18230.1 hypothetical protein [Bdellovibrionales bacterium]